LQQLLLASCNELLIMQLLHAPVALSATRVSTWQAFLHVDIYDFNGFCGSPNATGSLLQAASCEEHNLDMCTVQLG
jgi:hypothetical protein